MFRRHAGSVILLGGWLLMLPPSPNVGRDGKWTTPIGAEPVTEWEQYAAFDTAERCERGRLEVLQRAEAAAKKKPTVLHPGQTVTGVPVPPHTPAQDRALREVAHALAFFSRCVPAESVYPPHPTAPK